MINNNFIPLPNMMMNNNWMMAFNMNNNLSNNEENKPISKISIIFQTTSRTITTLIVNYGTTIDKLLSIYLYKVGRNELIGNNKEIHFCYNAINLKFGDQTPVEQRFKGLLHASVKVIFSHNLIGWGDILKN